MHAELVIRAQRGDEMSFGQLAAAVADRLFAIAFRVLRERQMAEDATHAALVRLWQDLPTLRDAAGFDGWSYRVLVRACEAEARRSSHRLADGWWERAVAPQVVVAGGSPVDASELERAFAALTVQQRAVLVLHHYLELSLPEMADALGIALPAARMQIDDARRQLRAAIGSTPDPGKPDASA